MSQTLTSRLRYFDAHNHLRDERIQHSADSPDRLMEELRDLGVVRMVVNSSQEIDWHAVRDLALRFPEVQPSYGWHPWYLADQTRGWESRIREFLRNDPNAGIGEIGLDRWKSGLSYDGQEVAFDAQMRIAVELERPVTIHCLKAWGRLYDLLRTGDRPIRGFLLHSYGGPLEMVPSLARMGAYFGFSGYFFNARNSRQRDAFQAVPLDRLLVETDAPDQPLPTKDQGWIGAFESRRWLSEDKMRRLNHPGNLPAIYLGLASIRRIPVGELAGQVEENFVRLFGSF